MLGAVAAAIDASVGSSGRYETIDRSESAALAAKVAASRANTQAELNKLASAVQAETEARLKHLIEQIEEISKVRQR